MTDTYPLESVLAVDCGSVMTKAVLIDVVEGRYRFIARGEALSTWGPPYSNGLLGVARAIAQIERTVGRRLLDEKAQLITPERSDGSGVDAFAATASAGSPLRLFLVGLTKDVSLASARQAALTSNGIIVDTVSLEDHIDRPEGIEKALSRLERAEPDGVVVVGGVDGGNNRRMLDLAAFLGLAYRVLDRQSLPPILYAGDQTWRASVAEILGDVAELRVTENVRPALETENLSPLKEELQKLYVERKLARLPGISTLAAWSRAPLLPTLQAQHHTWNYISAQYGLNVLALDLGAAHTTIGWATHGVSEWVTRSGWGTTTGEHIVTEAGLDKVLRWLSEPCAPAEAMEIILNQDLYPGTVPASRRESELTQALAREALASMVQLARTRWQENSQPAEPHWDLIVLSGAALTKTLPPSQAALTTLDALQPVGIGTLMMDQVSLAPALGAIAMFEPLIAAQVLEHDGFTSLGSVIAPKGSAKMGELAMRVRITYADKRSLHVEVPSGSIELIPLETGQRASLELRPGRRFDLGWARRRRATVEADGGLLGVIVDARGRPLPLAQKTDAMQEHVRQWLRDIGA